ncbi:MAG TPA: AraC family transcriptional regulator [Aerococcaceae bacterium]|nr:AraC family transcriptional regulator [Aerococcaceae bacterium]
MLSELTSRMGRGEKMHLKTTSNNHSEFYTIMDESSILKSKKINRRMQIQKSDSELFFCFNQSVRLTSDIGLALIVLTTTPEDETSYQEFILTNSIDLVPGVYFNTLAITEECSIFMEPLGKDSPKTVPTAKKIAIRKYEPKLTLEKLHTLFYQIKMAPFESLSIPGDYYELIIVDQGELIHHVDDEEYVAKKNDCFIYQPGQVRKQSITKDGITSYLSIIFDAKGLTPTATNQIIHLGSQNTALIERIIELSNITTNDRYTDDEVLLNLKLILLKIVQGEANHTEKPTTSMRENYENELFQAMVDFLDAHVEDQNQVSDLVEHFSLSRSTIQSLFNKYANTTPKNYINTIRLNRSKQMIQETQMTLSQIADYLGYGSIQYFSRAFSKEFGLSPSSYAKSIV